jgi:hypothetical protein
MYVCVRCQRPVELDDALCRSFAFGHCVCLDCFPAEAERASHPSSVLMAAIDAILAEATIRTPQFKPAGTCTLCRAPVVPDDVGVATHRRCLCLRCLNSMAGRTRSVPHALRLWISQILDEIEA